jgi:LysR family transcriptional activator of nhaA
VKFEITTGEQKSLVQMLKSHSLDVILTSSGVSDFSVGDLFANVIHISPVVFVSSERASWRHSSDSKVFKNKDIFIPGRAFEARPEIDAFLENLNVPHRIAGEVDDIALLRILALQSKGIVAIPEMGVKNELEREELKILYAPRGIHQRFYAITRHKLNPNDHIKRLINALKRS